ncbi:protein disulfide-isomerase 5-1 [Drosophila sechellia]|uniref:protein disulfide-isomerase 5-1 n=1 Tax=Drosophila sechellia TaxID=7238 RepID=UPI0013DE7226|nr:protein disulfide-isomerase 5-1 [Drosophila sechellia]
MSTFWCIYFLFSLLIWSAKSYKSQSEPSGNVTIITNLSAKPRSVDQCTPGTVLKLRVDNFFEITKGGTFFIKFYEPNCMGCHDFETTWTDLAKSFKSKENICFAELNCKFAKTICNDYELRYEPNLIWLENGEEVQQYDGDLTSPAIKIFVREMIKRNNTNKSAAERPYFHTKPIILFGWFLFAGDVISYFA